MATVVLSPRDCLPSTRSFQNSYLSSVRFEGGVRCHQAAMVSSPLSQDCAWRTNSGGSPPGDGILPVPLLRSKARALAKKSSPSKVRSIPKMNNESFSSSVKSKPQRFASAILPTPTVGSPPLEDGLLKERPSFNVQGNGPGNKNERLQANPSEKFTNQRHRLGNKLVVTRNPVSSINAGKKIERSKSGSDMRREGEPFYRGQLKDTMARMSVKSERSSTEKGAFVEEEVKTNPPVVTILQRPKSEEAAVKLFAKYFHSRTQQDHGYTIEEWQRMPQNSEMLSAMGEEKETEAEPFVIDFSESDSMEMSSHKSASPAESTSEFPHFTKKGAELQKNAEESDSADEVDIAAALEVGVHLDRDPLYSSKACIWETGCDEELATWERWAGPSYMNSPPPSALPLPRFSKRLIKVTALGDGCIDQIENVSPEQIPSQASLSPLYISLARQQYLKINADAVAIATKDLKRMLNLDLCRV